MYTSSLHMVSNNIRLTKADKRMVITPLGSPAHFYPIDVQASSRKSFTLATSQVSSSLLHWISSLPQDSPCFYHQEGLLIPILQVHLVPLRIFYPILPSKSTIFHLKDLLSTLQEHTFPIPSTRASPSHFIDLSISSGISLPCVAKQALVLFNPQTFLLGDSSYPTQQTLLLCTTSSVHCFCDLSFLRYWVGITQSHYLGLLALLRFSLQVLSNCLLFQCILHPCLRLSLTLPML